MEIARRRRVRLFLFIAVAWTLILMNGTSYAASLNGVLRQTGNQQVLNLWGTNYEMGYAHGYLLADKIRDLVDNYMIGTVTGSVTAYNNLLARDASQFQWQQEFLDEIRGMADGMIASGKNRYVPRLGRNIDSRDIRALNLQEEFYFGCSSFGVWRNATANGETILARNNDFYYDQQGNNANYQMIIAYEPAGKPKLISVAWPGAVGVYSGMNEYGVTMMANTGNIANPYQGPYHPVTDVYRTILESTTVGNYLTEPLSVVKSVHELPSEIVQIGIPFQGSGTPVYYIEQSPDLDVIRYPGYTDPGYDHIIATNHFLQVIPPPSYGQSADRYNSIRTGLINLYGTGDRKVDPNEAWGLLHNVANVVAPTLTSIIMWPNRMEFAVSFARVQNGTFTPATDIQPQTHTWASLFPGHDTEVVLNSLTINPTSVTGGSTSQGTVTLSGPAPSGGVVVSLSDNSSAAGVPATVTVAAGNTSATFTISTSPVANFTSATISAVYGGVTRTAALAINPTGVMLSALAVSPTNVMGGATSQGTVTLSGSAPSGGVVVSLSDNSSAAGVPATVTVASGSTSATFTITTTPVAGSTPVTISAAYGGVTRTTTLTINPPVLSSLKVSPSSVKGGSTSKGTVTLSGRAPSGGVVVSLSDNSWAASEPATVTVPSGSSSAAFTITTTRVYTSVPVTISASYKGVVRQTTLRITP